MKKWIGGMLFGLLLGIGAVANGSNAIQAVLFPASFSFNGEEKEVGKDFAVLNYNGHVYVPIRFVAESMNAAVSYRADNKQISILFEDGGLLLRDPAYPEIAVGNLQLNEVEGKRELGGKVMLDGDIAGKRMDLDAPIRFMGKLVFYDLNSAVSGSAFVSFVFDREHHPLQLQMFQTELVGEYVPGGHVKLFVAYLGQADSEMLPPMPDVQLPNGSAVPLEVGTYCWVACVEQRIDYSSLTPFRTASSTSVAVNYKGNSQPDVLALTVRELSEPADGGKENESAPIEKPVEMIDGTFRTPEHAGLYIYRLTGRWSGEESVSGDAQYGFVIEVH